MPDVRIRFLMMNTGTALYAGADEGTLHTGLRVDQVVAGLSGEPEAVLLKYLDELLIRDGDNLRH